MLERGLVSVKQNLTIADKSTEIACQMHGFSVEFQLFTRLILELKPMYAVIQTGGKQYRVAEGQVLQLEKLAVEAGEDVDFDKVLMVVDGEAQQVGAPYVNGAKVSAEVLEHGRGKKIHILKFKRRKHHMKRMGHRQHLTSVKIKKINKGK